MTSQLACISVHWTKGAIATAVLTLSAALSSCSLGTLDSATTSSPVALNPSPTASASATSATASEFSFPQSSCGDQATAPNEIWYPVYINNGDIAQIRSQYCKDAVSVLRDKTGVPAIQVASFTSLGKAQRFARAVGGEVDTTGVPRSALEAQLGTEQTGTEQSSGLDTETSGSLGTKAAILTSSEPSAPINIRERASTESEIAHVGYGGDRLQITGKVQGDDGEPWYSVRLESGDTGWVRGDFVTLNADHVTASTSDSASASASSGTTSSSLDRRSSVSSSTDSSSDSSTDSSRISSDSATSRQNTLGNTSTSDTADRSALLTASEPNSPINVRSSASRASEIQTTGYAGDRIQISERKEGDDGYTWYKVRLESGDAGWVRSDFVSSH